MSLVDYCIAPNYKKEDLEVLFYYQSEKGKVGKIINTDLDQIPGPELIAMMPKSRLNKEDMIRIVKMLVAKDICKGIVYPEYIESIFRSNQLYLILLDKREKVTLPKKSNVKISKPIGFVLGRVNTEDDLANPTKETYIDVICSCPKSGSFLLNYFIQFSEANGFNAVSLSSLDYVLTFYSRPEFGFKNTKSCESGTPTFVPGDNVKREMMLPEYKGKIPIEIPSFLEYLETLRHNGFGVVEGECNPAKNPVLTGDDYRNYRCGMNGYIMRRCMSGGGRQKKSNLKLTPMRLILK